MDVSVSAVRRLLLRSSIEIIFYCCYSLCENYYFCVACDRDVNYDGQVMLSIWNQFVSFSSSALKLPQRQTSNTHARAKWDEMHRKKNNKRPYKSVCRMTAETDKDFNYFNGQ